MQLTEVIARIKSNLTTVADTIREKNNSTEGLSIGQMASEISRISGIGGEQTCILVDEDGSELTVVLTDEEVDLTATANDIRAGFIAVTDEGITQGTKEIPIYQTREGFRAVPAGGRFILPTETHYDYTKLQAILCPYNTSNTNSVSAEKVVINDKLYNVLNTSSVSTVIKDKDNFRIDLGIVNESARPYVIRYFMYKEFY